MIDDGAGGARRLEAPGDGRGIDSAPEGPAPHPPLGAGLGRLVRR